MRSRIAIIIAGLGLTACFGGSPQPRYFALEPTAPQRLAVAPYPFTLLVRRFDTALAYDRREIVYRPRDNEVRFYEYRLWIAKPGHMLGEVVASHIDALGLFEAVTMRSTERPAQYELRGEVMAIDELDELELVGVGESEGKPTKLWKARLGLKLEVSAMDTQAVVWRHDFQVERTVAKNDPREVVATMVTILEDELKRAMVDLDRTFAQLTGTAPRVIAKSQ